MTSSRLQVCPVILLALGALMGCQPRNRYQPPPPPDVTVERPVQRDVTQYLEQTGQVAAINAVDLVARVQGYLQDIGYRDGDFVSKGTNLFTIEPAPYRAQLDQARANLASAEAKAVFDRLQHERYSALAREDATSRQQAQSALSDRDSADAAVLQARAALEQAKITYSYTHVAAPFDGYVAAHQSNIGALVGGNQPTLLATIVQLDPIWVNFNVSEQDVLRVRASGATRGAAAIDPHDVPVEIGRQDEAGYPHTGHLDYIAPQLDSGTGTLAVRAIFSNSSHALYPGYFVHIRIPIAVKKGALLVPDSALGNDQGGRTLLVVTGNDVAEMRSVRVGGSVGASQVIESGLKADDRVIVSGQQRARVGQKVIPHELSVTSSLNAPRGER
jgi:RND family efflux transporter MFP subunit